ncbi:ATP-grasp domain-containing protein [Amycolatopsis sp. NPDC051102]|uniref:ATP-grasp domain-containing protein n=1 Tax=Amycolatopsis sp. NPDC051102 TaxID=3155163 RepID=UPI00342A12E5
MVGHILIMGGNYYWQPALKRLRPEAHTSVLCSVGTLALTRELEDPTEVLALRSNAPVEDWVAAARSLHERRPVDVLASLNDIDQDKAAAVAEALNLPGPSAETVRWARHKDAMRERLAARGVENVPYRLVGSLAELEDFFRSAGGPIVVKPSAGRGSHAISIASSTAELSRAFERARSWNFGALAPIADPMAERFVPGPEFSVEAITHRGHHYIVAITEKSKDELTKVELGHTIPAALDELTESAITRHTRAVLDSLDVTSGLTHTEIIVSPDGPVTVETHLRRGGDQIEELVRDATGVDLPELFLRQLVGEDVGMRPELIRCRERPIYRAAAAIRYLATHASGTLAGVEGLEAASVRPHVVEVRQLHPEGARVPGLTGSDSRLAWVRVLADTPGNAARLAEDVVNGLQIHLIEDGASPRKDGGTT